ncbi:hypothetical protein COK29_26510, partial [Bacillus cereus]|uniref:ADP-ribosyltransferase n=1 Tax=Bacillus cereus TaxID=1396 RepID=UPI000C008BE3
DKEFKDWKKELSAEQLRALQDIVHPSGGDLNRYINAFGTDLVGFPTLTELDVMRRKSYLEEIQYIDKALQSKNAQLHTQMYVYQDMNISDLDTYLTDRDLIVN